MKKLLAVLALAGTLLVLGVAPAFAQSCDDLIAQVQQKAAQTTDPAIRNEADVVLALAIQLRDDQEADHCAYIAQMALEKFK